MRRTISCVGLLVLLIPALAWGSTFSPSPLTIPKFDHSRLIPVQLSSSENHEFFDAARHYRGFPRPVLVVTDGTSVLYPGRFTFIPITQPISCLPPADECTRPYRLTTNSGMFLVHLPDMDYLASANMSMVSQDGWEVMLASTPTVLLTERVMIGVDRLRFAGVRYGPDIWFLEGAVADVRELLSTLDTYVNRAIGATLGGGIKFRGRRVTLTTGFGIGPFRVFTLDYNTGRWRAGGTVYGYFTWRF